MIHEILTMSRGDAHRLHDWLDYHHSLGFNSFRVLLDNPIDDSEEILRRFAENTGVSVMTTVLPPLREYYDGLSVSERWQKVLQWRKDNEAEIKSSGYPIGDSLSWRQYTYFPPLLREIQESKEDGWLALIDVDEYIVLRGGALIGDLTDNARAPRLRFLNFNFDMADWDQESNVRLHTSRWSREDLIAHGKGWDTRVKSMVRFEALTPMASVHSISRGKFETVSLDVGQLNHYKFPNQGLGLKYSIVDDAIAPKAKRRWFQWGRK